jgi:hypothetical protein
MPRPDNAEHANPDVVEVVYSALELQRSRVDCIEPRVRGRSAIRLDPVQKSACPSETPS